MDNVDNMPVSLNRRRFMTGAAGLTFGVAVGVPSLFDAANALAADKSVVVSPYVTISTDGTISIMSPAAEMGQGSLTSLPLILAEELDADWAKVKIVPAPPIEKIYGNPGFNGLMYTAGSFAVNGYFTALRTFGAPCARNFFTERAAWRMRCSFSTSASIFRSSTSALTSLARCCATTVCARAMSWSTRSRSVSNCDMNCRWLA